jgi:hypothetical protein
MGPGAAAFFFMYTSLAPPPASPAGPPHHLAELAWMAGQWQDRTGGALSEETWTAPEGDCMLGMWRLVSGGQAKIYELLLIREEAGAVTFTLRHFDPRLHAREEKETPITIALLRASPEEAVFEGRSSEGGPLRLTYTRQGVDALAVRLEKNTDRPEDFRFQRLGTGAAAAPLP